MLFNAYKYMYTTYTTNTMDEHNVYKLHTHTHTHTHTHLTAETKSKKEIGLDLSVDDNIMIGQDFFVRVTLTNKTSKTRNFELSLKGNVVLYTGASGQLVKSLEQKIRLKGQESE